MRNAFIRCLFAAALFGTSFAHAANNTITGDVIKGHSFEWHWEKGAYKGAGFGVNFKNDGTLVWRGIAGPVNGKTDSEKQYETKALAKDIYMVSWLEKSGYAVTIVLNFADNTCQGIVSNNKEWYPLEGKFIQKN